MGKTSDRLLPTSPGGFRFHLVLAAWTMLAPLLKLLLLQLLNYSLVDTQVNKTESVKLRFENGNSPCAGRVGIHYKGLWGTMYDTNWDLLDATVVCRELDCGTAVAAPRFSHFGPGSGPIMTGNVHCSGTERALRDCPSETWRHYKKPHSSDASVICSANSRWPSRNVSKAEAYSYFYSSIARLHLLKYHDTLCELCDAPNQTQRFAIGLRTTG
ncbi:scavenger receptor cysteine-rich domain-containing group B protein-like [Chiloscyllium plagiosum]|uniref:scavenger receptor cysteine-rich domain-containing group B protein-like n=1 Tax=Chiloscyllium plagiosum TaxID=36176 RepID=UPI001CB8698C|nr:scavenger receptor cysteine-rich domain-containing group B protein-like [Chiloscyllium plagiosum]